MSVETARCREAAMTALAGAIRERRLGNNGSAASLAYNARQFAEACRRAALMTSADDVNDVQAAEFAASQAEDVAETAGARCLGRRYPPGYWRQAGWKTPALDGRAEAIATLDRIIARGQARGTGRR